MLFFFKRKINVKNVTYESAIKGLCPHFLSLYFYRCIYITQGIVGS